MLSIAAGALAAASLLAPLACAVLASRKGGKSWLALGAAGAACAIVGAVCLRVVFYELGLSVFMFY